MFKRFQFNADLSLTILELLINNRISYISLYSHSLLNQYITYKSFGYFFFLYKDYFYTNSIKRDVRKGFYKIQTNVLNKRFHPITDREARGNQQYLNIFLKYTKSWR